MDAQGHAHGQRRAGLHVLILLAGLAQAATLEAWVDDSCTLHGTLTGVDPDTLADPLAALPLPQDDLVLQRTFPGATDTGVMEWTLDQGVLGWVVELPHRYGAVGCDRRSLWGNGGWYPQVLQDGTVGLQDWDATVHLPPGSVGTLNGVVGHDTLVWSGRADRLSLAVFEDARVETLAPGVTLLARGPERPRRNAELAALAPDDPVVIVESEQFRRLARPGHGVLYVSDMAFRTPKALHRLHREAVGRGLLEASLVQVQDPWSRQLAATALGRERTQEVDPQDVLRFGAWLPLIDSVLYSGRLPFHAEVFDETFPADPLLDDVGELWSPVVHGRVMATKLDDRYGPGTALAVSEGLLQGQDLAAAATGAGVDPDWLLSWRGPVPVQDLVLSVRDDTVIIERIAEPDAPEESVPYRVNGERYVWDAPAGPGVEERSVDRVRRVALDPDGHVSQDRVGDTWPTRWTTVGTATLASVNLSEQIVVAYAAARIRRQYDTHNVFAASATSNAQNRVAGSVGYLRYFGPLQDRRQRNQRVSVWVGGGWLSPGFRSTVDGRYALEAGTGWVRDTRVDYRFPLRGTRLSASVDGGVVPESGARWGAGRAAAVGAWSPHPRLVGVGRGSVGVARGQVEHRLFDLGGPITGLPPGLVVGQEQATAGVELRWMVVKNASVPLLWLYWLDEIMLTGGVDAGAVRRASIRQDGAPLDLSGQHQALGWSASLLWTMDGLGAIEWTAGFRAGGPIWVSEHVPDSPVQVFFQLGQPF